MTPWEKLGTARVPGSDLVLTLQRRNDEYSLRVDRTELMNSRQHGSEEQLATLAAEALGQRGKARVLVGGLGMGFTLRAALDSLPADAAVTVVELVPEIIAWNHEYLRHLAGFPLQDSRTTVVRDDVANVIRGSTGTWDLILLDTDNGPEGTTHDDNEWLYGRNGLGSIRQALAPGGVAAFWSAFQAPAFARLLRQTDFRVTEHNVRARGGKSARHVIWLAAKPG